MFFSEEKNQKTFMSCAGSAICSILDLDLSAAPETKVFLLLFFQKKKKTLTWS
jgi:hypothetical protein